MRELIGSGFCVILILTSLSCETSAAEAERIVDYATVVRPVLSDRCFACHGPDAKSRKVGLRLDVREVAVGVLRSGHRAIVPGDTAKSELVKRITHRDPDERMPPEESHNTLSPGEIVMLTRWIRQGAEYAEHWAFAPPVRHETPVAKDRDWSSNWIDGFILAKLESNRRRPSQEADRRTLIRRLSFDLIGLPPTPKEVDAFVADTSADAYEKQVDRLLASAHYGERMAIRWLDLVRYADSNGYHADLPWSVWPYRDYVINAFNSNMPFDRFTREQIAGDLIPGATIHQKVAAAYNRLNMKSTEFGIQEKEYIARYAADRVRTTATTWLDLTVGCAECHDHKFDPITTRDFYRFAAFFADIKQRGYYANAQKAGWGETLTLPNAEIEEKIALIKRRINELELQAKAAPSKDVEARVKNLNSEIKKLDATRPRVLATVSVKPRITRVLRRGDWMDKKGEIVEPGVPVYLSQIERDGRATRMDLANWLVDRKNPLTARVFVNRLWQQMFGSGLYRSLGDIGSQGDPPSHRELIDTLAVEFVESGWDVKHTLKLIAMSSTYRQSSVGSSDTDPYNRLLARQSRWRLDAELIRDNALTASGLIDRRIGGPSVKPYQPTGYWANLFFPKRVYAADTGNAQYRRGLYTHWQRQFLHPALLAFDAPSREQCTAQRARSNTPLQALVLLNDPTHVEVARVLASNAMAADVASDTDRLQWVAARVISRQLNAPETQVLTGVLNRARQRYASNTQDANSLITVGQTPARDRIDPIELASWTQAVRVLLNSHETITRN